MNKSMILAIALLMTLSMGASAAAENTQEFRMDQVFESEAGTCHYNLYVPDDYDGSKPYALHIALPGWEGLYFQGVGEDLRLEYLPFESRNYVDDMVVVSAQLNDWGETSARQAVALTEFLLSEYNIDPDRVFITGYSGGGETLSRVMELKPELYTAALFVSSQWDNDPQPLVVARTPLYLFTAEHDSYYGSEPVSRAYQRIHDLYAEAGLTEEEIDSLRKSRNMFVAVRNEPKRTGEITRLYQASGLRSGRVKDGAQVAAGDVPNFVRAEALFSSSCSAL